MTVSSVIMMICMRTRARWVQTQVARRMTALTDNSKNRQNRCPVVRCNKELSKHTNETLLKQRCNHTTCGSRTADPRIFLCSFKRHFIRFKCYKLKQDGKTVMHMVDIVWNAIHMSTGPFSKLYSCSPASTNTKWTDNLSLNRLSVIYRKWLHRYASSAGCTEIRPQINRTLFIV